MTDDSRLNISIDQDKASRDLKKLESGLKKVTKAGDKTSDSVEKTGEKARAASGGFGLLKSTIAGVFTGAAIAGFARIIATFEALETSLGTVFQSMDRGKAVFADIQKLAEITPFAVEDLTTSVIKLRAAGIEPTTQQLTLFSDTASVTTDAVGSLVAITDLFSRTTAGGLGLMDLNRLADRGIPVFSILEEKLGLARLEVVRFGRDAKGAATILEALTEGLEERFGGASLRSTKLLRTSISNLGDSFDRFLKRIGDVGALSLFTNVVQGAATVLDWMGANMDTLAVALTGLATLAIPTVITAIEALTLAMAKNPVGLIVVGITAAVTALYHFRGVVYDTLIKAWEVWVPNAIDHSLKALLKMDRGILNMVNVVLSGFSDLANGLIRNTPDWLKGWLGIEGAEVDFTISTKNFDIAIDRLEKRIHDRTTNFKQPARPEFLGLNDKEETPSGAAGLSTSGSLTGDRLTDIREDAAEVSIDKEKERLASQLELLENSLLTEEERLFDSYANRQFIIEDAFENELISEEKRGMMLINLSAKYEGERLALEKKSWTERQKFAALSAKAQTQTVIDELINMTAGVAQHNKVLFEINKTAGIANAIVNTYEGVTKTLATYPQPLAGILAAGHLMAGLAQVDAIRSTSFGTTGAAPSGVTGGAGATNAESIEPIQTTQQQETSRQGTQLTVIVEGNTYANDDFQEFLVDTLRKAEDNDVIQVIHAN